MNFWKEIKEALLNFSAMILTKIETLTSMAKYKIAIKNMESEIEKIRLEIGDYTIIQIEQKEIINEEVITFKINKINELRKEIDTLTEEYNSARKQFIHSKKTDTGSGSGNEKQAE